jgi:hypothetical protein
VAPRTFLTGGSLQTAQQIAPAATWITNNTGVQPGVQWSGGHSQANYYSAADLLSRG